MNLQKLTQTELAEMLNLSTRQVRNLEEDGLPAHARAGKKSYAWHEVLAWMRGRWETAVRAELEGKDETAPSPLEEAELRKALAEAERAETRNLRERGELAADEDAEAEIRRFCERVRAGILALRSRHQASMVGLPSIPAAGVELDRIAAALLTDLHRDAGGAHEAEDLEPPAAEVA